MRSTGLAAARSYRLLSLSRAGASATAGWSSTGAASCTAAVRGVDDRTHPVSGVRSRAERGPAPCRWRCTVTTRNARIALAVGLAMMLTAALVIVGQSMWKQANRIHVVAYFENSNGLFVGDEVRILGVPVG